MVLEHVWVVLQETPTAAVVLVRPDHGQRCELADSSEQYRLPWGYLHLVVFRDHPPTR